MKQRTTQDARGRADGLPATSAAAARRPYAHEMFGREARLRPEATALVWAGGEMSYGELDRRADGLAARLRARGVGPESLVGLCVERSPELIVALLGVLRAGGAYVPLDPTHPSERLSLMLKDAGAALLLTQRRWREKLSGMADEIICLDGDAERLDGDDGRAPGEGAARQTEDGRAAEASEGAAAIRPAPENVAYVIYTSGSTGAPKGVMVTHGALANFVEAMADQYGIVREDRLLQFASPTFDASAEEIYCTLARGATLVLRSDAMLASIHSFLCQCAEWGVTALGLPTAFWHQLAAELDSEQIALPPSIRLVIVGGEGALPEHVSRWLRRVGRGVRLMNGYGPTETTVVATACDLSARAETDGAVSIGRAIAGVAAYVADAGLRAAADGEVGELCVGGAGLARGYLNDAARTAERFVPDPFSHEPGARLYRTGDLARRRADGDLECLGRIDSQVKIRGFRVELGEVEAALAAHPELRAGVAVVREDTPGEKQLVAYVVPRREALKAAELRRFLKGRLPAYMIPSAFVSLAELPLLSSGKPDRGALPPPGPARADDEEWIAPRTPVEERVARIWAEVLGAERVGATDNFFELGGHSLRLIQIAARLRESFGVEVSLSDFFDDPTVAGLAESIARAAAQSDGPPPVRPVPRDGPLPVSFPQQAVWFLSQLMPGTVAYNSQLSIRFRGRLDRDALERALTEIVRRHEIFRTAFAEVEGQPVQRVCVPWAVALPPVDLGGVPAAGREAEAERLITQECRRAFDPASVPLVRWTLLRLAEDDHVLVQVEHHFVHDGWSLALLLREMKELYEAFAAGRPSPLAELPIQFADFAAWQRERARGPEFERHLSYWRGQLAGHPPPLELPADYARPKTQSFRGATEKVELPAALCRALAKLSQDEGVTLFMTMLAAFEALLCRYTGQEDIVIGSALANRTRRETERLIGMIVNSVVLRVGLAGDPSFRELLRRVRRTTLEAYTHQDVPFEKLVEELKPGRDLSRNPLFQVMFSFHDSQLPDFDFPGLKGELQYQFNSTAKFDLDVVAMPRYEPAGGGVERITMEWEYSTDLYDAATIRRVIRCYENVLEAVAVDPERRLSRLPLLKPAERRQALTESSGARAASTRAASVQEMFAEWARRTPDAVAVVAEDEQLTYGELGRRAAAMAARLRRLGVGPESRVALLADRSPALVAAMLATLEAGGAYVPLDPAYPPDRLRLALADSAPTVVLARRDSLGALGGRAGATACLDEWWEESAAGAGAAAPERADESVPRHSGARADALAYVIYTSGSTGEPKGVMVCNRSLANYAEAMADEYELGPGDRVLQFASPSFDASAEEIYCTLTSGATLVLRSDAMLSGGADFLRACADRGVTVAPLPTAFWHELAAEMTAEKWADTGRLRLFIIGGEMALPEMWERWQQSVGGRVRLVNTYGPTETTIAATHSDLSRLRARDEANGLLRRAPIGRPVSGARAYVLGPVSELMPEGAAGELYVGGAGLARGYLNDAARTAERFVPDPFSHEPGARLYRTGDLARRRADGDLEYMGRADRQLKIRGFRVEPGEVEAALLSQPGVRACAVEGEGGGLAAYVCGDALEARSLRAGLEARLPRHLVPTRWVIAAELPLLSSGKVDRQRLAEVESSQSDEAAAEYVGPRTETEQSVAAVWAEVLGVERVGVDDNFFDLGGHSLLATRIISRLRDAFGVAVLIGSFFESPTVARLAAEVERLRARQEEERALELLKMLDGLSDAEVEAEILKRN